MKRFLIIFVLVLVFSDNGSSQVLNKVAVLDPAGNLMANINTMIREEINNNVIRANDFVAVERNIINRTIIENNYTITGQIDIGIISSLGAIMGADLICHTTATTLGPNYYISCKIINVSSASVISENTGITQEGLSDLFKVVSIIGKSFFPNQNSSVNTTPQPSTVKHAISAPKTVEKESTLANIPAINFMGNKLYIMPNDVITEKVTWQEAKNGCANSNALSYDDWRLPTKEEISQMYFNKTSVYNVKPYWYWSSSSRGYEYYRQAFDANKLALAGPNARLHVRCVRNERSSSNSNIPSVNCMGNEVFVMPYDITEDRVTWNEASANCSNASALGFTDWRLPTKDEISTLYLNKALVGQTKPYWYWSGTSKGSEYYRQAFDANKLSPANPNARYHVRCVRTK